MAKLDIAKLAGRLAELNAPRESSGEGNSYIAINDGRNVVRILPPKDDKSEFAVEAWVHYNVGKTANNKGTLVVCPRTVDEKAYCPVCELSSQLKKMSSKKDDTYDKQAKEVYRKKRVYYNAIDRTDDLTKFEYRVEEEGKPGRWYNTDTGKPESPIKVLATGIEVYKKIIGFIIDPEYGDVTDPESGLDIIITKSGSGQFNTNYEVISARKESVVGFKGWEKHLNDIAALAVPKPVSEIEALMEGKTTTPSDGANIKSPEIDHDADKPVDISEPEEDDTERAIQEALARRKANQQK